MKDSRRSESRKKKNKKYTIIASLHVVYLKYIVILGHRVDITIALSRRLGDGGKDVLHVFRVDWVPK